MYVCLVVMCKSSFETFVLHLKFTEPHKQSSPFSYLSLCPHCSPSSLFCVLQNTPDTITTVLVTVVIESGDVDSKLFSLCILNVASLST